MKKFMQALATFAATAILTLSSFSPSYADEISVMFQPDGAAATKPFGIMLAEDDDGALVMSIRDSAKNKQELLTTIKEVVQNGITGSITAIFSWEAGKIPNRRRQSIREQVLFNGEFGENGEYTLVGVTLEGRVIRWYLPSSY